MHAHVLRDVEGLKPLLKMMTSSLLLDARKSGRKIISADGNNKTIWKVFVIFDEKLISKFEMSDFFGGYILIQY